MRSLLRSGEGPSLLASAVCIQDDAAVIELGIFHNGATWAEPVEVNGVLVTSGDLAATQAARRQTLLDQIRQGILAERLGFETFWLTEHHFQPEGPEFSPNPVLTQMAIAARTRRIRL